ncbi:MAG: hypothetical protein ACK4JD_10820 [Thermoflexales bacterium]
MRQAGVVQMVGAVSPEVRELIQRNIQAIWVAACRYSCQEPLTTLYAQREALDLALAYLAPLVNDKRGVGSSERVSLGRSRAEREGRADGSSQNWSCDWSNTGSYAVHQTNGDGYTRARSATDGETFAYFRTQSWDRGRTQQASNSRSDASKRATTTRANEQRSAGDGQMDGYSTEGHGQYRYSPVPSPSIQHDYSINLLPDEITLPGGITIGLTPINVSLSGPLPQPGDLPSGIHCDGPYDFTGCLRRVEPIEDLDLTPICPRVLTELEVLRRRINALPVIGVFPNFAASAEFNIQLSIPIPGAGSFNLSYVFQSGAEQRPRWATGRNVGEATSTSQGLTFLRSFSSAGSQSVAETRGFRENDAHMRGRGDSSARNDSRSASLGRQLTVSEVHTGSNTDAHGQAQASSVSESESKANSLAWQRTVSERMHRFDIQKYSDAFDALSKLRARVEAQIERIKGIFKKGQFAATRIQRMRDPAPYHPALHVRGYAGTICAPKGGIYAVRASWH